MLLKKLWDRRLDCHDCGWPRPRRAQLDLSCKGCLDRPCYPQHRHCWGRRWIFAIGCDCIGHKSSGAQKDCKDRRYNENAKLFQKLFKDFAMWAMFEKKREEDLVKRPLRDAAEEVVPSIVRRHFIFQVVFLIWVLPSFPLLGPWHFECFVFFAFLFALASQTPCPQMDDVLAVTCGRTKLGLVSGSPSDLPLYV